MEFNYAHIENGIVTSVEVVDDAFFEENPERYAGTWIKVGDGTDRRFCGIGWAYNEKADEMIPPQPFPSWKLNKKGLQWEAPMPVLNKPCYWNEEKQKWILVK